MLGKEKFLMVNITTEIENISTQTRGEDVRDAIVNACQKLSNERLPVATTEGFFLTVNPNGEWEAIEWT